MERAGVTKGPVALIILDGWGINESCEYNAIRQARTPHIDALLRDYPSTRIGVSGGDVGLPDGQMGNSEVGHLNIGAGRIVYQDLTRISKSIADGDFAQITFKGELQKEEEEGESVAAPQPIEGQDVLVEVGEQAVLELPLAPQLHVHRVQEHEALLLLHEGADLSDDRLEIGLGGRFGLYRALHADGPATSAELAARTGTAERYVREWLEPHAASGLLEVDGPAASGGEWGCTSSAANTTPPPIAARITHAATAATA